MGQLGDAVRRKIHELGVDKASEFFGVCKQYVTQWRDGSRNISAAALEKVFDTDYTARQGEVQTLDTGLEGRKFAFLLPWYKATNPMTAFSIFGNYDRNKMRMFMVFGDAYIAHSRNTLSRMFLDSEAEWAFMVDDDMVLPIGNAEWFNKVTGFNFPDHFAGMSAVRRLLSHRKTLVGGLYFGRFADGRPMFAEGCNIAAEAAAVRHGPRDQVRPTKWIATGALLIHRSVFEAINKQFPTLGDNWFSPSEESLVKSSNAALEALRGGDQHRAVAELDAGLARARVNSKVGMGEDVTFCLRAAAAGHQPHVDLGLVCGHIGQACYGPFNTRPPVISL